jgi:hypothetical protein
MMDLRALPENFKYDDFKIAVYVRQSFCLDSRCDENRQRVPLEMTIKDNALEDYPCKHPIELSNWMLDPEVSKHNKVNMSFLALEDLLIKFEIHMINGLFLAYEPFFRNSTTVTIVNPSRAMLFDGSIPPSRPLSRTVSYEEKLVPQEFFFTARFAQGNIESMSAPLNLPPLYAELERGRVLMSYNATEEDTSWPTDPLLGETGVKKGPEWWKGPHSDEEKSKMMQLKFRETFHEFQREEVGDAVNWKHGFDQVVVPYLPFFSNCRGFDSYIPIYDLLEDPLECKLPPVKNVNDEEPGVETVRGEVIETLKDWERRKYPPLPHQDDIKYVGPEHIGETPLSDWCERHLKCKYEEDLSQVDVVPRWFELDGGALFDMYWEPSTLDEYMAGGSHMNELESEEGSDVFIPFEVDREAADDYPGECTDLCFPRSVSLMIEYYQKTPFQKRIITGTIIYDNFDEDQTNTEYELDVSFRPLDYVELIITFSFEFHVFVILFCIIGAASLTVAMLFWLVNRLTTSLQTPPKFRFFSFLALIAPSPLQGVAMACLPIMFALMCCDVLLNPDGVYYSDYSTDFWLLDDWTPHFMVTKLNPDDIPVTRDGRYGLCFAILGAKLVFDGAHIFLPTRVSKREQEIAKKRDAQADKEDIWIPTVWKRSNMIFSSFVMAAFLVLIVEFSFWDSFGDYIWHVIIGLKILAVFIEMAIDKTLKEHLLICPLVSALALVQGLVTLGSDDFKDFLLSYFVEFGMMMVERVYVDPGTKAITDAVKITLAYFLRWARNRLNLKHLKPTGVEREVFAAEMEGEDRKNREVEDVGDSSETVEPILDAFTVYANETQALFYQPFIFFILMNFRDPVQLPDIYGIREQHMLYYLIFCVVIIPFQLSADIFIHNVQELFHGWKVYDYLVYTQYRFLQRETRWKGLEDSLDECIEEGMRTIDQMCFSSQFYFMSTIHTSGIILLVFAIETMVRADYNMFGDEAMIPLVIFILALCYAIKRTGLFMAYTFKIWKIKHENTSWHHTPDEDDDGVPRWDELEKIKGASHEAYLMNQRITSETFRYKFLNYNRPWLVAQLPSILTPRTLRRSRPYLITQFTKILGSVNPDISDDSESDEDEGRPKFGPVSLSAPSRNIIRMWLAQARRRRRLHKVVEPIINQARKAECEICLSRRQLQVELVIPLEVLADKFEKESMAEEFDQVAWKEFFKKHEQFRTLCLDCMLKAQEEKRKRAAGMAGTGISGSDSDDEGNTSKFGPVFLSASSRAIMIMWYRKAQDRVFGRGGRARPLMQVSDDEDEDAHQWGGRPLRLSAASKALAIKWLRTARVQIMAKGGPRKEKRRDPYGVKNQKRRPGGKAVSGAKSRMRRK